MATLILACLDPEALVDLAVFAVGVLGGLAWVLMIRRNGPPREDSDDA